MALNISNVVRVFRIEKGGMELSDPDASMSLEEVMNFYSGQYPELTTAAIHGPAYEEDRVIYTIKTTVGTKG